MIGLTCFETELSLAAKGTRRRILAGVERLNRAMPRDVEIRARDAG